MRTRANQALGMVCGILTVAVLAGGVLLVNNYSKMQKMESILTSVLPAGMDSWNEYKKEKAEDLDFIVEEIKGSIKPTEAVEETGEYYQADPESSLSESSELSVGSTEIDAIQPEIAETHTAAENTGAVNSSADVQPVSPVKEQAVSAGNYRIYEVGKGETLYGICWKTYGNLNSLAEICELNDLSDVDRILAGQKLLLP